MTKKSPLARYINNVLPILHTLEFYSRPLLRVVLKRF